MDDITPSLLKKIQEDFRIMFDKSKVISNLYAKVRDGTATYVEANEFAIEAGEILTKAFGHNLSSAVLPDGKMYYNIAERIIGPMMTEDYELVVEVTQQVQEALNKAAGIGIKAIKPELNKDRIDGIINRIAVSDKFDDVSWLLDEPIKTFSQSIVDDSIKENAEFHAKSGLQPIIIRKVAGNCCDWCKAVAGTYSYPDNVPKDVYRRHQRCRCTVDYVPQNGKVQNIYSKKWISQEEYDKIQERKKLGLSSSDTNKSIERKVIGLKVNGVTIHSMSEHVFERMDSREVDVEEIIDAISKPLRIKDVKLNVNGMPSFQVIGEKASIAINPETGNITTTWRTGSRLAKKLKKEGGIGAI